MRLVAGAKVSGAAFSRQTSFIHGPFATGPNSGTRRNQCERLFNIIRVIEQRGQINAAMAKLRVALRAGVGRVQVRGGIIRRKQDQEVEERDYTLLILQQQACEPVS